MAGPRTWSSRAVQARGETDKTGPSGRLESRSRTLPPESTISRQPPLFDRVLFRQLRANWSSLLVTGFLNRDVTHKTPSVRQIVILDYPPVMA